ncbi:MAG: coproporphyrinogen III oxidase family protein [Planctomycetes bacterium]|nr:coproporphyrinogen III oxidase family protein [Planctomycetota bacterium]
MTDQEKTGLGNYFVANYPPFSAWKESNLPDAHAALNAPPRPGTPLGLYLHIPFCRKRCKFCYFRVYTDKNARDVEVYMDALLKEVELYRQKPVVGDRTVQFVYFGGGTPSYLSAAQLRSLCERVQKHFPWNQAAEVTFECEPGTLQQHKLETLKQLGVTRLSLGIENFNDTILEANGRAHLSAEIFRAYQWARDLHFTQINIDLIAGMVGETWDNWRDCVRKTIELAPESVTIYQMELPYNTVFSRELNTISPLPTGGEGPGVRGDAAPRHVVDPAHVADWPTKRAWVDYAFAEMANAGYSVSSAYTMVREPAKTKFVYRDSLWHGADMFGTGVASFGHVNGVHVQNVDRWEHYVERLHRGELPLGRAMRVAPEQLLRREMMLQLKTGRLQADYFRTKFGTDIVGAFADGWSQLQEDGFLTVTPSAIELTRAGLLQVDRLLPTFFEPEHRSTRYT